MSAPDSRISLRNAFLTEDERCAEPGLLGSLLLMCSSTSAIFKAGAKEESCIKEESRVGGAADTEGSAV
jgi:hypothetical protein